MCILFFPVLISLPPTLRSMCFLSIFFGFHDDAEEVPHSPSSTYTGPWVLSPEEERSQEEWEQRKALPREMARARERARAGEAVQSSFRITGGRLEIFPATPMTIEHTPSQRRLSATWDDAEFADKENIPPGMATQEDRSSLMKMLEPEDASDNEREYWRKHHEKEYGWGRAGPYQPCSEEEFKEQYAEYI